LARYLNREPREKGSVATNVAAIFPRLVGAAEHYVFASLRRESTALELKAVPAQPKCPKFAAQEGTMVRVL